MPITTGTTNVVKQAAAEAQFPAGSIIKAILLKVGAAGTYDGAYATPYPGAGSMADEVATGNGYTAGGQTLSGRSAGVASNVGYVDYSDVVWTAVGQLSAIGCAFWDQTLSRWCGFVDFGGTKTATDGAFTVQIPGDGGSGLAARAAGAARTGACLSGSSSLRLTATAVLGDDEEAITSSLLAA